MQITTFTESLRTWGIALCLGATAALFACGGGSGDASTPIPTPLPAPPPPVWQGAALIEQDNAGDAGLPQIAIDPSGNGMAVWHQSDANVNGLSNIWANRYSASTGWGTATLLEQAAAPGFNPQVAVDANGNAIAVWRQQVEVNTPRSIVVNRFDASTNQWGTTTLLETSDLTEARQPQIAMHASGNAVVVWIQAKDVSSNYDIWANHYTASTGAWGSATLVEMGNQGHAFNPQVALDGAGNAMALWQQVDGAREEIWANRYSVSTGLWGTATAVDADYGTRHNAVDPRIAMDDSGNATAVWSQYDGTNNHIWGNRYTASTGRWSTATLAETDNTGSALRPTIAMRANGNAIAVWEQRVGARAHIMSNTYSATSGWGTAKPLQTNATGTALNPQMAMDGNGNAMAVWMQFDGTTFNLHANYYSPSAGWGSDWSIDASDTEDATDPALAMSANGKAIAVWGQYDGTRTNIWANVFK